MNERDAKIIVSRFDEWGRGYTYYLQQIRDLHTHKVEIGGKPIHQHIYNRLREAVAKAREEYEKRVQMVMRGRWISEEEEAEIYAWKKAVVLREDGTIGTIDLPEMIDAKGREVLYDDNGNVWIRFGEKMVKKEDYDKVKDLQILAVVIRKHENGEHTTDRRCIVVCSKIAEITKRPPTPIFVYARNIEEWKLAEEYDLTDKIRDVIRNIRDIRYNEYFFHSKHKPLEDYSFEYHGKRYHVRAEEKNGKYSIVAGRDGYEFRINKDTYSNLDSYPHELFEWIAKTIEQRINMRAAKGKNATKRERQKAKRKQKSIEEKVEEVKYASTHDFKDSTIKIYDTAKCFGKRTQIMIARHESTGLFAMAIGLTESAYRTPQQFQTIAVFRKKQDAEEVIMAINRAIARKVKEDTHKNIRNTRDVEMPPRMIAAFFHEALKDSKAVWHANEQDIDRILHMLNVLG